MKQDDIGDLKGGITTVFIDIPPTQDDLYSKAYGQKFGIPLPNYKDYTHLKNATWDDRNKGTLKQILPSGDIKKFDSYGNQIDIEKIPEKDIKEMNFLTGELLRENKTAKFRWQCRSQIDCILGEYLI